MWSTDEKVKLLHNTYGIMSHKQENTFMCDQSSLTQTDEISELDLP